MRPTPLVFSAAPTSVPLSTVAGVARPTGTFLDARQRRSARRRPPRAAPYASFDTDWVPKDYLSDFYRVVEADERATIDFFVDAMAHADSGEPLLLFGVGPTLHHVFLTAGAAAEIHLADYLPANLREIERWWAGATDAHDWRPFVEFTLECEGDGGTERRRGARAGGTRSLQDHHPSRR
jgi:hypothetical protein